MGGILGIDVFLPDRARLEDVFHYRLLTGSLTANPVDRGSTRPTWTHEFQIAAVAQAVRIYVRRQTPQYNRDGCSRDSRIRSELSNAAEHRIDIEIIAEKGDCRTCHVESFLRDLPRGFLLQAKLEPVKRRQVVPIPLFDLAPKPFVCCLIH
jgi:hypothetical protein